MVEINPVIEDVQYKGVMKVVWMAKSIWQEDGVLYLDVMASVTMALRHEDAFIKITMNYVGITYIAEETEDSMFGEFWTGRLTYSLVSNVGLFGHYVIWGTEGVQTRIIGFGDFFIP